MLNTPLPYSEKKNEGLRDPLKGKDTPPLKHFVGFFFEQWWKAEITVGKHIAFSPFKQWSHFRRMIRGK